MIVTVRSRLYVSLAFIIGLCWIVAAASYLAIVKFNDLVDDIVGDDLVVFETLSTFREANLFNRIYWREAIHAGEAETLNVKLSFANRHSVEKALEQENVMKQAMERLRSLSDRLDEQDRAMVQSLDSALSDFLKTSPVLREAVESSQDVAAAGRAMAEARDKKLLPVLDKYYQHKKEEVDEAEKHGEEQKSKSLLIVFSTTITATLLAVFVGGLLSRSISIPLSASSQLAGVMATGDFTQSEPCKATCGYGRSIRCDGKSCEIGRMSLALNGVRDSLSAAVSRIQQKSSEAHGYSTSLANSMRDAVNASRSQAELVMRVSSATEELTVSVGEVAQTLQEVVASSENSHGKARDGMSLVAKNQGAMDSILKISLDSSKSVVELRESTAGIQELTQQIHEIAAQTNLLALNAAIEAARAGESGRGFSVVADEVRKLAEKTGATSKSIEQLAEGMNSKVAGATHSIEQIMHAASQGTQLAKEASGALELIVAETASVQDQVKAIGEATEEQKSAAQSIAQAMEETSTLSEENEASLNEIDATARELKSLAEGLNQTVNHFRIEQSVANNGTVRPAFAA